MKTAVLFALFTAQLATAVTTWCFGASNPSPLTHGDVIWALENHRADLGFPGNADLSYQKIKCTEQFEYTEKNVLKVTAPRIITDDKYYKLKNGDVVCQTNPDDLKC